MIGKSHISQCNARLSVMMRKGQEQETSNLHTCFAKLFAYEMSLFHGTSVFPLIRGLTKKNMITMESFFFLWTFFSYCSCFLFSWLAFLLFLKDTVSMQMQAEILLFFQRIGTPFLDKIAVFITMFGNGLVPVSFILFMLWCVDKRKGFAIIGPFFLSTIGFSILKAIIRMPRPFTVISGLKGKDLASATGYSFPSGHTTNAATVYSALAIACKKRTVSVLCAVIIVLVGVSRMYLGVHWPMDVAGGLILGCMVSFLSYPMFYEMDDTVRIQYAKIMACILFVVGVVLAWLLYADKVDKVAYSDMLKTFAAFAGIFLGMILEEKFVHYQVTGSPLKKTLRFIIGFAVLAGILAIKNLFKSETAYYPVTFVRYFLLGIWGLAVYPWLGKKVKLFE